MNDALKSRLVNWKFSSALPYATEESLEVHGLVAALSETFGDCGIGLGGNMGVLIEACVAVLIGRQDE